ncbi:MAG: hypothetical protein K6G63_00665, partial [Eubacterium sp.]|nr:hypothetical protein [Eubacterium sp.]
FILVLNKGYHRIRDIFLHMNPDGNISHDNWVPSAKNNITPWRQQYCHNGKAVKINLTLVFQGLSPYE